MARARAAAQSSINAPPSAKEAEERPVTPPPPKETVSLDYMFSDAVPQDMTRTLEKMGQLMNRYCPEY